jgi:hypothetical protein
MRKLTPRSHDLAVSELRPTVRFVQILADMVEARLRADDESQAVKKTLAAPSNEA